MKGENIIMTETFEKFSERIGITMKSEVKGHSFWGEGRNRSARIDYRVTLKYPRHNFSPPEREASYTLDFHTGTAYGEITVKDVLYCLQADYSAEGFTFEEFCSEYGYDQQEGRREARKTYNAVMKEIEAVKNFMGIYLHDFLKCTETAEEESES